MKLIIQRLMLLFLMVIAMQNKSFSQELNYGLRNPQPDSTLPRSKAPFVRAQRIPAKQPVTALKNIGEGRFVISEGWEMTEANEKDKGNDWYNAVVPGTVLTTLVNQGVYPDPYFGLNNLSIPDSLCRKEWWYRVRFDQPSFAGSKHQLILNGINYKADVWLNGKKLGSVSGAFTRGIFGIDEVLKQTGNELSIHIFPPPHPGIPHEESARTGMGPNGGQLCWDGPTFISSEGWDWIPGIRDRNIGIWQDVQLKVSGNVLIKDPQVITDLPLPDTSSADVTIKTSLVNSGQQKESVILKGRIDNVSFDTAIALAAGETRAVHLDPSLFRQLRLSNPKLWWPNGYGNPELYTLHLSVVTTSGRLIDEQSVRFGVREFSYELAAADMDSVKRYEFTPLQYSSPVFDNLAKIKTKREILVPALAKGAVLPVIERDAATVNPFLVLKVNGVKIYCKGGNWGMDDGMKRSSRARLEPYIRLHREANFNMIRNWTGESTEDDLYALCDEYGILVWNDFWLSTGGYNLYPEDNDLFLQNAEETIVRFRNHPSIAIWCARNEGYPEEVLEKGLADLVVRKDGTRHYQPNSRILNLKGSGPWHYFTDPAEYFRKNAGGFSTELGTPSIPTAASMRKMMPKEDLWPISDTWYYHDLHGGQQTFRKAMDSLYGPSTSLDDFCRKAQFLNYESHRAMFESWSSRLWDDASGLLLWMTHPAWPSMVWQVYSWDYETFASYHASQKACEPVHIQMNLHDNKIVVINTSQRQISAATIEWMVFDINGKPVHSPSAVKKEIKANAKTEVLTADLSIVTQPVYLVRVLLKDDKGIVVSQNDYWKTNSGNFNLFSIISPAKITGKILNQDKVSKHYSVLLKNTSSVPVLNVKLNFCNRKTGEIILPAFASDGYFSLMPGEERVISISGMSFQNEVAVRVEGFNLDPLMILK